MNARILHSKIYSINYSMRTDYVCTDIKRVFSFTDVPAEMVEASQDQTNAISRADPPLPRP